MATQYLQVWDYIVIAISLILSSGFGLYYGLFKKEETSTAEYLLAGRNMKMLPIALSYFASLTSTAVIIGHPAEVYSFGFQLVLLTVTVIPCIFLINEFFLPIYHRLQSGSVYEYLELRFNVDIKNFVTGLAVFQTIFLSSANVYGPATVLNQVTGINTWLIVAFLAIVCIIYTTLGGMRAVILADVVQAVFMLLSMVMLVVLGIYYVGDISVVFDRNYITGRLNIFKMDFNLNVRQTFWNTTIGYIFTFMSLTVTSQFTMQRFMTAPSVKVAKRANIVGNLLCIVSFVLIQSVGLVMYATFHGCDPLKNGEIKNMDQLLPAYIMKILSSYPSLPGLIFTGILCASLSTLSSVYNSTATIIMASFVRPKWPKMSDESATFLCKVLVFTVGILSTFGVTLAELFPNVLQSVLSFYSTVSAPLFGIILIGIFCPQASIKAIYSSFICAFLTLLWMIAGTLVIKPTLVRNPLSTDLCDNFNSTLANITNTYAVMTNETSSVLYSNNVVASSPWEIFFPLSSISYMWYSAVGTIITIVAFILLTFVFGKEEVKTVNSDVIPDIVQNFHKSLPKPLRKIFLCDVYDYDAPIATGEDIAMMEFNNRI